MSNHYAPEIPDIKTRPALSPNSRACMEAVNEAIAKYGCSLKVVIAWLDYQESLGPAYRYKKRLRSTKASTSTSSKNLESNRAKEDDDAEAENDKAEEYPVSGLQQDHSMQNTPTQAASAKPSTGNDTTSDPSNVPTAADIDLDLKRLEAEFDRRIKQMQADIDSLEQPLTAEKLTRGARLLNVELGQLKDCLLEMGVTISPEAAGMGGGCQ
jgi:hypothetical protein